MGAFRRGKEAILRFYASYDTYCTAAVRFAASFLTLYAINAALGNPGPLNQPLPVVIGAVFCSFLSSNVLMVMGAVFLEAQFFGVSLAAAAAGAAVILIWLLVYFSFLPGQGYVAAATGLLLGAGLPFAAPVVCGLLLGPGAAAGIVMGTGAYELAMALGQTERNTGEWSAAVLEQLPELFRTLIWNQEMLILLVLLPAVFLTVFLIRRIPAAGSWQAGIGSGILVYGLLHGIKWLLLGAQTPAAVFAADLLLGTGAGFLVLLMRPAPDYGRVERLQFEDDDYYYYVKAVPKKKFKDQEIEISNKGEEKE